MSAPAGYGKTTLLAAWSHALAQSGAAVAWYALDAGDDDPIRFGSYLVASLDQALGHPSELAPVAQLLRSSPDTDLPRVLPLLINVVSSTDQPCVLVLDDYHLISAPAIHSAVAYLLERLPDNLHVVIGSRSDPPLPLARLRARDQLLDIRAADLRFTVAETAQFLNEVMGLGVAPEVAAALEAQTEGWVAGLQLAALSLAGRPEGANFLSSFTASNRYLVDYLLEEVVSRQTTEVQTFLLATSILDWMCGPLCDALLGNGPGSAAILDQLEEANLFVVPLDEQASSFRYHHLFRDFLRTHLDNTQPERVAPLHRVASEWHAANGLLRDAVAHALQTRDWTYAAEVVERHGMPTLMHSEISTVYQWCAAFPEEIMRTHPMLCILQAWTLVLGYRTENRSKVEVRLQQAERAAAAMENEQQGRWLAGQAAVVRTFLAMTPNPVADPRQELALARRALDLLPEGDPLRSTTTLTVGYVHLALQDAESGGRAMEEARELSHAGHNYYGAVEATFHLARLAHLQGQLQRAAAICRQGQEGIATVLAHPEQDLPAVGCLDIALGCVLLEQNQLADAERTLLHGRDLIGWTGNPFYQLTACVALFRLREIQGRSADALAFLDRLQENWPDIAFCTQALRVVHSLRMAPEVPATRAAVAAWCQAFSSSWGEDTPLPGIGPLGAAEAYYLARLAWVRAQVALGTAQATLPYLERQLGVAAAHGLTHRRIELSVAEAQVRQAQRDHRCASEALERALTLAEPEGYVRSFDQGMALTRLLGELAQRGIAREYVGRILEAMGTSSCLHAELADKAVPSATAARLRNGQIETLSARELEVLRLTACGASNHVIADELVITVGTVKSHINHIAVKLDVHNRTAAVARARELGLLGI